MASQIDLVVSTRQALGVAPGTSRHLAASPVSRPAVSTPVNASTRDAIPFQDWAREKSQEDPNRRSVDDPTTFCIPQPSPRITPVGLFPIEFMQTKDKVVILYEYFNVFRSIPIGSVRPPIALNRHIGNSVARWDGDVLGVLRHRNSRKADGLPTGRLPVMRCA